MQIYVVGFYFDSESDDVVLIEKKRPAWQAGLLNGVGGHVEKGETALRAIRREFREEAGVEVVAWTHTVTMLFPYAVVYIFKATGPASRVRSMTDESVVRVNPRQLHRHAVVDHLRWLIPLVKEQTLLWPIMMGGNFIPSWAPTGKPVQT